MSSKRLSNEQGESSISGKYCMTCMTNFLRYNLDKDCFQRPGLVVSLPNGSRNKSHGKSQCQDVVDIDRVSSAVDICRF